MKPAYSKLPPSTDGADQRKIGITDVLKNKSPVKIFELFFTEILISHIRDQSLLYATQKNNHTFNITRNCIKKFLGILLFPGFTNCLVKDFTGA